MFVSHPELLNVTSTFEFAYNFQLDYKINVRENRRGNQELTIQRNRKHWVHKTRDEDKTIAENKTDEQHGRHYKLGVNPGIGEGQSTPAPSRQPPCYLHSQYLLDTTIRKQTQIT